ncbi:MAG: MFS transporter, partial [Alphaproteobacteria bacterium]
LSTLLVLMTGMYAALAALAIYDVLELWHLALGVIYSGVFWAFELPVRRTMAGDVAGPARLPRAMGLESATNSITRALGPFIGGALYDWVGIQGAFALGASVCIVGAALLATVVRGARSETFGARASILTGLMEGARYIGRERVVQAVLVVTIILNLFGFACVSMFAVLGREYFQMSASETGMLVGAGTYICCMGAFAATGMLGGALYVAVAAGFLFVAGFGLAGFGSMQSGLVLARTPPHLRVRVMGVLAMCIGSGPIGILNVGWIAEEVGAAAAVVIVTSLGFLCYLVANLYYPELRRRLT